MRTSAFIGVDFIKILVDEPPRSLDLDEMEAVVKEAHRSHMQVCAHATTREGIHNAVVAGVDVIDHGYDVDDETLQLMREKGVYLDATDIFSSPEFLKVFRANKLSNSTMQERMKDRLQRAMKAGVKIVAGSDMWWDFPSKNRGEASALVFDGLLTEGMSPADVLRSAASTAAESLGWQDRVGSIEPGHFADLIALEGDPLRDARDLEKVSFVMKGGKVVRNDWVK